jgi:ATP-dependent DNA helicase RecQ
VDGERTKRFGFTQLSTFGLLSAHDRDWIVALLRALLAAGWIDLTPSEHPVPFVTRAGGEVMRAVAPARIILPPRHAPRRPARGEGSAGRSSGADRAARSADAPSSGDGDGARKRDATLELDAESRPLFERLRAHRAELARARHVPAYVIALDRTLVDLAIRRPGSLDALVAIYGFGPNRIEQYGQGFLDVLRG